MPVAVDPAMFAGKDEPSIAIALGDYPDSPRPSRHKSDDRSGPRRPIRTRPEPTPQYCIDLRGRFNVARPPNLLKHWPALFED
jgi:hypothetical protein